MTSELRFVFDTNTLISALLLHKPISYQAFAQASSNGTILISAALIAELSDVLNRPKFDKYVTRLERLQFVSALAKTSLLVEPTQAIRECREPRDDMVLELAVAGNASFIVSGDLDLLTMSPFRGIEILRPSDFMTRILE